MRITASFFWESIGDRWIPLNRAVTRNVWQRLDVIKHTTESSHSSYIDKNFDMPIS